MKRKLRDLTKKLVYIDMDGVLVDFKTPYLEAISKNPGQLYPHSQYGFFMNLKTIKDAIKSFRKLEEKYDVWILTRPSVENPLCYTEKAIWVRDNLGMDIQRKTVMCCDKSLLKGDYLIDDTTEYGQTEFEGEFIHFDTERFPDWETVVDYLMNKD